MNRRWLFYGITLMLIGLIVAFRFPGAWFVGAAIALLSILFALPSVWKGKDV